MDIIKGFRCSRRDFIRAKLEQILKSKNEKFHNPFPSGWLGESPYLVFPKRIEIFEDLHEVPVRIKGAEIYERELESFRRLLCKTLQKCGGEGRFHWQSLEKLLGIASSYSARYFGNTESFFVGLIETLDAFSSLERCFFEHLSFHTTVLIVGDSGNFLISAINLLSSKLEKPITWSAIIRDPAYEGVMRNYEKVNDVYDILCSSSIIKCSLLDESLASEVGQILNRFKPESRFSIILADATGESVLEQLDENNLDATKWLFLTRQLIQSKLSDRGSVIIRLHVKALTNLSYIRLLFGIARDFAFQSWVLPPTGRDTGLLYLGLYNYEAPMFSDVRLDKWPLGAEDRNKGPVYINFERIICNVLIKSIPPFLSFVESSFQMMNCDEDELDMMNLEMVRKRKQLFSELDNTMKRYMDFELFNRILGSTGSTSLLFNWHMRKNMQMDARLNFLSIFPRKDEHRKCLLIDILRLRHLVFNDREVVVAILQDYTIQCTRAWETRIPKSVSFPQTMVDFDELSSFTFDSSPINVILSTKWCVSGIVFVRGILKEFVMPHANRIVQRVSYEECRMCESESFFKLSGVMQNRDSFKGISKSNTKVGCFGETFKDFSSRSDKQLAYDRVVLLLDQLKEVEPSENYFACALSMLSRLDMGAIYLITSMFKEMKIVTSMTPHLTYGILFRKMRNKSNYEPIRRHILSCIQMEKAEFVNDAILTEYYSTHFIYVTNVFVINQFLKRALRNTLNIEKPLDNRFRDEE